VYYGPLRAKEMNADVSFWLGLALAVPLSVAANLLTPHVMAFLDNRKLIKTRKTRAQAILIYNRIRAFKEGRRDKYAYYFLLASSAVLCAIASATIFIAVLLTSPSFDPAMILLLIAFILALFAVACVAGIYETARQLERFDDYKREFEQRWGPLSAGDLS
jgi:ABC-type transport system involved in cytochrome bd biosynthesis fused ATPase/permease subunit